MTEEQSEKVEYLNKYENNARQIYSTKERIEELRYDKTHPSVVNDGMPHAHNISDLSNYMVRMNELEQELQQLEEEKLRLNREISAKIEALLDEDEKDILTYKYIRMKNWKNICRTMHISRSKMYRIHDSALENFVL